MAKASLSVIITCFNKEKYLDEAVQSVLDQTIQPREIIIVHDGCDNPSHHVSGTTIILPKNIGVGPARDCGVRYSGGQLLLFLDGDDKLAPDFIEKSVWGMKNADIVYPNMLNWYEEVGNNKFIEAPNKLTPKNMLEFCKIPVTSTMKRSVYESLHGFMDFQIYEDWDFWLRAMVHKYKFNKINTYLWYRQYPNTRNRQSKEIKGETFRKIRSQFEIIKGELCPSQSSGN